MKQCWLLVVGLCLLASPSWAAVGTAGVEVWYSRPATACPINGDGLAYACASTPGGTGAFSNNSSIIWTATTGVDAGDTLYICGTHLEDPVRVASAANGAVGNPLKINFSCPGDPGKVVMVHDMTEALTAGNWTNESGNLWYLSTAGYTWKDPRRLWFDGFELLVSDTKANLGTHINGGTPTSDWWFDSATNRLYVYSTLNPSTGLTSVKSLVAGSALCAYTGLCMNAATNTDIEVINPNIEGGQLGSVYLLGPSRIKIYGTAPDNSACTIGKDTLRAVLITDTSTSGTGTIPNDITVQDCTLDNVIPAQFAGYQLEWNGGLGDVVHIAYGATNVKILSNTIRDGTHMQVNVVSTGGTTTITNVTVQDNDLTCRDQVQYCRGFAIDGSLLNKTTGVWFIGNRTANTTIRNQVNGNGNYVVGNYFGPQRQNIVLKSGTRSREETIQFEAYADISQDNIVAYNTFDGNAYAPCVSWINNATATSSGHIVTDNIFYNCGGASYTGQSGGAGVAIHKLSGANIGAATIRNNIIYSSGTTTTVGYKGTQYTVSGFQSACNGGDVCATNLAVDPQFVSATERRLSVGSAGRRAGVTTGVCVVDMRGRVCIDPPDLGAVQSYDTKDVDAKF